MNGSSLAYILLGPALWIPFAVFVVRECDWRRALGIVWRTAVLAFLTSLWWISGLGVESKYGLDVLRFTETIKTTSSTTSPLEVLRGLGYWYFYGKDALNLWNAAMPKFTQTPGVILASLLIPALALLAAVAVRWTYRAYFVLLVVIGVGVSVGAQPYGNSSPIGAAFKSLAASSSLALALRNSDRAVPLIVLGIAVLLAVFVERARSAAPRARAQQSGDHRGGAGRARSASRTRRASGPGATTARTSSGNRYRATGNRR